MTYRFVQAYHDLGPRRGPILGFTIHMAEGGGTVGFLSRQNRYAVSVHWVIQYDGDIVQMLREDHMHTSIRITSPGGVFGAALRRTDDADGFYGGTAARAVLGEWAYVTNTLGPNHATLAVELEGFAIQGPNAAQKASLARLIDDVRSRYPRIGLLGHRDHNVKACPGRLIPWSALGGHGPATAQEVPDLPGTNYNPDSPIGTVTVTAAGNAYFNPATRIYFQISSTPMTFTVHGSGKVPDKPDNPGAFRGREIWVVDVGGTDCWLRKDTAGELVRVDDCKPRIEAAERSARSVALEDAAEASSKAIGALPR